MGRTKSGTAQIGVEDEGLVASYDPPDTTYARDIQVSIDRGDVSQASFSFSVDKDGQSWKDNEDGIYTRTITKVNRLFDVSVVTYPAYPDTSIARRDMSLLEQQKADIELKAEQERQAEEEAREREEQLRLLTLKSK
jgi:hypothetical protein